ncbi:60S ribosomal protein L29 [Sciurus carolinensis]|uniref:Large ribosomal subunit protein eL29 n=1 Tax=Sciurus carolinensis TaxID=30640 RepID=A0AA41MHS4_SCICA|nr:60S ribosomal protein L29 [Sciurus carolinensis]
MAQDAIKKLQPHRRESLKGINPQFLRNMHFAKKYAKKGLGKMQTSNPKARGYVLRLSRPRKSKEVKRKEPKDISLQCSQLAYTDSPSLEAGLCPHFQASQLCQPKA